MTHNQSSKDEELLDQIKHIQGHCFCADNTKCWYGIHYKKFREQESDGDVVDRMLDDASDKALLALVNSEKQRSDTEARLDELKSLPRYNNPRYGIANKIQVSKEWMRNRLEALNQSKEEQTR